MSILTKFLIYKFFSAFLMCVKSIIKYCSFNFFTTKKKKSLIYPICPACSANSIDEYSNEINKNYCNNYNYDNLDCAITFNNRKIKSIKSIKSNKYVKKSKYFNKKIQNYKPFLNSITE